MESLLVAAIIIGVINLYRYWKQNQDTEDVERRAIRREEMV